MNTHKTKVKKVRAIQFTGDNILAVADFLEVSIDEVNIDPIFGYLRVRSLLDSMDIKMNWWVVDSDAWIEPRLFKSDHFNNIYEKI